MIKPFVRIEDDKTCSVILAENPEQTHTIMATLRGLTPEQATKAKQMMEAATHEGAERGLQRISEAISEIRRNGIAGGGFIR